MEQLEQRLKIFGDMSPRQLAEYWASTEARPSAAVRDFLRRVSLEYKRDFVGHLGAIFREELKVSGITPEGFARAYTFLDEAEREIYDMLIPFAPERFISEIERFRKGLN